MEQARWALVGDGALLPPMLLLLLSAAVAGWLHFQLWRQQPTASVRLAWLLIAIGYVCVVGEVVSEVLFVTGLGDFEAIGKLLGLCTLLPMLASNAVRIRSITGRRLSLAAVLDSLTVTLAATALEMRLFAPTVLPDDTIALRFWLTPALVIILIPQTLYLVYQSSGRQQRVHLLLALTALFSTVAGWLSALELLGGLPWSRSLVYLFGSGAILSNILSGWLERGLDGSAVSTVERPPPPLPLLALPYALLGLVGVATVQERLFARQAEPLSLIHDVLGWLCIGLVLARQWLVLSENRRLLGALRSSRDQASREARTDALTDLPNQRLLREYLVTTLAHHRRTDLPLTVIFIDLDHFKAINDTLGHFAGDMALIEAGRRLRQTVRAGDIVARYGGEEYVVLLPTTDAATAALVAERLRSALADQPLDLPPGQPWTITASLGLAAFPDHGTTVEELLGRADQALYLAKQTGRNRLMTAAALPATPATS